MSSTVQKCKNCDAFVSHTFQYCPYCSQEVKDKLTLGVLFSNTVSSYFSVDGRLFKSILPMLLKPGHLAKAFVNGKRKTYLHPAQFYLFVSLVFFFLFSISYISSGNRFLNSELKRDIAEQISERDSIIIDSIKQQLQNTKDSITNTLKHVPGVVDSTQLAKAVEKEPNLLNFEFDVSKVDSLVAINANENEIKKVMGMPDDANFILRRVFAQALKFYKNRGGNILKAIYETIPIVFFLLVPIFAWFLKLLFFRTGTYASHLVFSLYYFTFLFSVFIFLVVLNQLINIPEWISVLVVFSVFIYLVLSVRHFYEKSFTVSFIKSSLLVTLYFIIGFPIGLLLVMFTTFMFVY